MRDFRYFCYQKFLIIEEGPFEVMTVYFIEKSFFEEDVEFFKFGSVFLFLPTCLYIPFFWYMFLNSKQLQIF